MSVTLSEERIEAIDIDSSGETGGIADVVFTRIPNEIIEGQTLNVDAISGASVTSKGVLNGVVRAVCQAGANPDALRSRPKAPSAPDKEDKTYDTELVIVGGGGAGLTAAARALRAGKKVILVEKFPAVGGNTVRAGGPMNAPDPVGKIHSQVNLVKLINLQRIMTLMSQFIDPEFLPDFQYLRLKLKNTSKTQLTSLTQNFYRIQTYLGGKTQRPQGHGIHGNL